MRPDSPSFLNSLGEGLKMGWMFFWRVVLILTILGINHQFLWAWLTFFSAFVVSYGFHVSVKVFPIIRLVFGQKTPLYGIGTNIPINPFAKAKRAKGKRPNELQGIPVVVDYNGVDKRAPFRSGSTAYTKFGQRTGYEPSALTGDIDFTQVDLMKGVPGHGLSEALESGVMEEENVIFGQLGELNLAKAMAVTGVKADIGVEDIKDSMLNHVRTFWSVSMPSQKDPGLPDTTYNTDIDCVVVSGNKILLLDAKMYRGGNVVYRSGRLGELVTVNPTTKQVMGKPYIMGRNMPMALERFSGHYPTMDVSAMVVLITPESGEPAGIDAWWSGGIPLVTLTDAMERIAESSVADNNFTVTAPMATLNKNMMRLLR